MVITGVGGTGVVTIGAVLAQAAQIDGKGAGMMEMAGLAQKGGAVHIHCRLAERPEDIAAIRVATGECDALIGGDLVVSAGAKTLGLTKRAAPARWSTAMRSSPAISPAIPSSNCPPTGWNWRCRHGSRMRVQLFDATELARAAMGDSIFSNMMIFGAPGSVV